MSNLSKKELRLIKKYPHLFNITYTEPEYRLFNGMLFSSGKNIETITWAVISGNPLSNQALAQLFAQYASIDYTKQLLTTKVTTTTKGNVVYGTDENGKAFLFPINVDANAWSIAYRNNDGSLKVGTPSRDTDAVNLKYFNEHQGGGDVTKEYVDTQDSAVLETANSNCAVLVEKEASTRESIDEQLANAIATTNSKIPESASTSNMLITQSEMDTAISQSAARYITADSSGNPFGTRALLISGPWYYNGEAITAFQRTDYAIVSKDETHNNALCRYMYTNTWAFQYVISTTLTAEQLAALNSTITEEKVTKYNGYEATINSKASSEALDSETARATSRENAIEAKIPTKTSELTNDSGFLTEHQSLTDYAKTTYVDTKVAKAGDTMSGNLTIEKTSPEVIFNGTGTTNYGGFTWKQQGTIKYQCRYNSGLDKVYFQDSDNKSMVVPKGAGTLAKLSDIPTLYVEITYSELVTLRDSGKLNAGCWYRITDYVATTTQTDTQATSNQYDIIVLATSTNTLSEEARAIQHSGDTYFVNSNLNAWKVWYCLDNDTNRFYWADSTNGKGIVYHLIDEFDNSVWYDFKLIQVKNSNKSDRFYYLFDNSGVDASLSSSTSIPTCYCNNLGFHITSNKYQIGCNIFYGGNYFYSNTIGNDFCYNTIENYFYRNTIGNVFWGNTIGNYFYSNTIGNDVEGNTIGNAFCYNTIGNDFYSNTIGNDFCYNTIGNYFYSNNLSAITTQPQQCDFSSGIIGKITTSTTSLDSKRTYYLGSDGSLKSLS